MLHLKNSATEIVPSTKLLSENNIYPYSTKRIKQIIKIEGARQLLVVFDVRCSTLPGINILRFYKDVDCKNLIGSFSEKEPDNGQ